MSTAAQPLLPADIRLMNGVSALLLAGLVLAGLALALHQLARLPIFGIRHIQVEGDVMRNSVASLRANAMPHVSGTFLTLNLQQASSAFQAVPWVRTAVVQRVWPNRLRVRLEEHRPAAYWEAKPEGADAQSEASVERALVNSFGEVFEANLGDVEDEDLPVLAGPEGSSVAMLAMWQQLNALSLKLGESARRLDLSGRGSWRLTLEKGAVVELGRGSEAEVLARFGQFAASITQISSRYQTAVLSADLRHHDGYAVRLQGISTSPGPATGAAKKR
ncbi:cell division protein FtsQ/DivIB [Paucibacter sp. O1-1]|nr:cell division protein FtsQ/DivIB [Paucibacter sp. O1-1]MDA3828470.1 cell division protein FtsQ/DivIB [Paucibacter sp. O1-1]